MRFITPVLAMTFAGFLGIQLADRQAAAGDKEQYLGANAAECEINAALSGKKLTGRDARLCGAPPGKIKVGVTRGLSFGKRVGGVGGSGGPVAVAFPIQFDSGSASVSKQAAALLDKIGRALSSGQNKAKKFVIEGHADARGAAETNMRLSEARARSVREYLIGKHGIDAARLRYKGRGETDPIDPENPTAAVNRRVVLVNTDT